MDGQAAELWKHAPAIAGRLDALATSSKESVLAEIYELLGLAAVECLEDSRPGCEDFEYALNCTLISRLESDDHDQFVRSIDMLDIATSVVVRVFERAARPGATQAETERCKQWWSMLFTAAEDTAKLIPTSLMSRLVDDFERSLPRLRTAYARLTTQRLSEFDAKQAQAVAAEEADTSPKDPKEQKAKDEKRVDERKKMITHLGTSPNGQLYLTLTSLLKQLGSRLCNSLHASLRARVLLLLEQLLAMDHKAIANNQKHKTTEFIQADDLDAQPTEGDGSLPGAVEPAQPANGSSDGKDADAKENGTVGSDPSVNFELYRTFWGLQESLQHPDRVLDKESWQALQKKLLTIFGLFKKYKVQELPRQPWSSPEPAPLRQAPRAQTFAVQLGNPGFRQQFLTQVLLAFQTLEQDGGSRRENAGGLIGRQTEATRTEFAALKRTCEELLEETRPGFLPLLRHAFEREPHWVTWKTNGCREFERESLEMLNARIPPADTLATNPPSANKGKPQLAPYVKGLLKTLQDPQWKTPTPPPPGEEEAAKAMRSYATKQMCDAYLDRLIEEDKPENEIEEEYKAKKNKVLMWQCRRLFCQQYLRVYAQKEALTKTDFMEIVGLVKGKPTQSPSTAEEAGTSANAQPAADTAMPSDGPDDALAPGGAVAAAEAPAASDGGCTSATAAPDHEASAAAAPNVDGDGAAAESAPSIDASEVVAQGTSSVVAEAGSCVAAPAESEDSTSIAAGAAAADAPAVADAPMPAAVAEPTTSTPAVAEAALGATTTDASAEAAAAPTPAATAEPAASTLAEVAASAPPGCEATAAAASDEPPAKKAKT